MICLIKPPMFVASSNCAFSKGIPPIGLAYISGSLKRNNIDHMVIDGIGEGITQIHQLKDISMSVRGLTFEEIIDQIPEEAVFIAVSIMFSNEWFFIYELIKRIKKKFPKTPILLGGEHVSADAGNILKFCPEVDYCAFGEGDETIIGFYHYILGKKELSECTGFYYRQNEEIKKLPPTPRITHVDELKPNWESIPVENYLSELSSMNTVSLRAMPMTITRGCPYECTFCSSPQMWGKRYVLRSPENIVNEMRELKEKYQVEHIDFTDLSPTVNKKWTQELCRKIIEANLGLSFQFGAGTRSEILDKETLRLLKEAGLWKLILAAETGSEETQVKIKKKVNLERFSKVIKEAKKMNHHVKVHFIIGFPSQTLKEALESTLFLFKAAFMGVEDTPVYSYMAYPGTELTENLNTSFIDKKSYLDHYETLAFQSYLKVKDFHNHGDYPNWIHPFLSIFTAFSSTLISRILHPKNLFNGIKGLWYRCPKGIFEMVILNGLNKKKELQRLRMTVTTVNSYLYEHTPEAHSSQIEVKANALSNKY